mgnify:CR=1 FL=1
MTMLCITIAKLGGCREEKMITFPASFRSSNYNYKLDNSVSEVHQKINTNLKLETKKYNN